MTLPYLVVAGSGRSGSNRILEVLHQHPDTLCRNEPFAVSDLKDDLPAHNRIEEYPADFIATWHEHVAAARFLMSLRDHYPPGGKRYYRYGSLSCAVERLLFRHRVRGWISKVLPAYRARSWPRPILTYDRPALEQSLLVLKHARAGWIAASHRTDEKQRVIHNIRDPRGYLNSWYNRYVLGEGKDLSDLFSSQLIRLPEDHPFRLRHHRVTEAVSVEHVVEAELWLWRTSNEMMQAALQGSDRALVVRYRDFGDDPEAQTRALLDFAGLAPDEATLGHARSGTRRLFREPHATRLDPQLCSRLIERVLSDSPLTHLVNID